MTTSNAATEAGGGGLDPALLARVGSLELRARMLAEGVMSGMHRSPYRGFSVEFVEHRKYSQGDDLRHLDWKVYGRSDKFYVKQYEQETNLQLMLVVDASESMSYRGDPRGLSKYEYAATLAGALAYLVLQQADAVGLTMFDDAPRRSLRASNSRAQFAVMLHEMEIQPTGRKTRIGAVLDGLAESLERRHLVVLLSDLFDDADGILRGLRHLHHRRHEPVMLHVMDHAEIEFPFTQQTLFEGLEGYEPVEAQPRMIRQRYLQEVQDFVERVRRGCRDLRGDYALMDTSRPLDAALSTYLTTRAERK